MTDAHRAAGSLERLTNWQVAVLALHALGGATARQRHEDIAVKCYELAPGRFGWKRHDYPDIERAGAALRVARQARNGTLVTGGRRSGWMLTPAGIDWARQREQAVRGDRCGYTPFLSAADRRELGRLARHRLYALWRDGGDPVSIFQVADAVGLSADAPADSIARRLDALEGTARAGARRELEEYLGWLRASLSAEN